MLLRTRAFGVALLIILLVVPVFSSALTIEEIRAQIQAYREQIAELQRQLQELRHPQEATSTPPWPLPRPRRACALLTHDILLGSTSDVVRAVQEALAEDRSVYPEGLTTGYFGPFTQAALERLRLRLEAQGFATTSLPFDERAYIGPWLRALLLRHWCPNVPLPTPPTYACPVVATTTPTELCAGTWERLEGFRGCHVGWRCVPTPPPSNKPPGISSFEGPTELRVDEAGTWTIRASDPENNELSYRILWGEESVEERLRSLAESDTGAFTSTTTFTHAYGKAGHYIVHVTVRDGARNVARAVATVNVTRTDLPWTDLPWTNAATTTRHLPDNAMLRQRVCPLFERFQRDLTEGMTGNDVRGLQELLRMEGLFATQPTGYYGAITRDALERWQGWLANLPAPTGIGYQLGTMHWGTFDRATYERALQRIASWCQGVSDLPVEP